MRTKKIVVFFLLVGTVLGLGVVNASAKKDSVAFYVPLIGITSVPDPLAIPEGAMTEVTYYYAVKNFLSEMPLSDVLVVDDQCAEVVFVTGDDNNDSKLDDGETWRYSCTTTRSETTRSTATVTGTSNNITTSDSAFAIVNVGSENLPPLVSIVNITKVAYPLSLPAEGGDITFTYRVNNPGAVPLSDVAVSDNKCGSMSGKVGDTNGNYVLDVNEVWIYTCTTRLNETTTNTATVTATANGLEAIDHFSLTVQVENSEESASPMNPVFWKYLVWGILTAVLIGLLVFSVYTMKQQKTKEKRRLSKKLFVMGLLIGAMGIVWLVLSLRSTQQDTPTNAVSDALFGWRYPVASFPSVGPSQDQLAYSDIRDPGGIPQGLPVRLKNPNNWGRFCY